MILEKLDELRLRQASAKLCKALPSRRPDLDGSDGEGYSRLSFPGLGKLPSVDSVIARYRGEIEIFLIYFAPPSRALLARPFLSRRKWHGRGCKLALRLGQSIWGVMECMLTCNGRKTERLGMVETPIPRRRTKKSLANVTNSSTPEAMKEESEEDAIVVIPEHANGHHLKTIDISIGEGDVALLKESAKTHNTREFEFGGPLGVSAMMVGFPLLMYYMWIGATFYNGKFPLPTQDQSIREFLSHLGNLVYEGAFPHRKAWAMYWVFFVTEAMFYVYLPGYRVKGKPLPHEGGRRLDYYCSGLYAWYATIAVALGLHVSGVFPLYTILDEFGPIMSVAIISGYLVSMVEYASALYRGAQHRMTGSHIYDFFMGAELNPRILGILDLKMFYEVRIPWFILFLITLSAAARQYEQFGYVSGEVAFLLMAHWLYTNACAKAEECIVATWYF